MESKDPARPPVAAPAASPSATDRIERSIDLRASRARAWQALADAASFGTWFGADLAGQAFEPGRRARGRITHPGYGHLWFDVLVERVVPPDLLSFRWHPYAVDETIDHAREQPTLVTFTLHDLPGGGTRLTVVESGFDALPAHRRDEAFRMNGDGWTVQMDSVARHVDA